MSHRRNASQVPNAKGSKPNIIYILTDDLGYGDISCYGQTKFTTPHIDRMAETGMRFSDHYAGSTVCAPSRCALLTGQHTGHAQIRGNYEQKPEGQAPLAPGTVTVPALLKQAGYTTGMFGKWGLGGPGSTSDPVQVFDEFFGYNCQRLAHSYYPDYLWHQDQKVPLDGKTYSHDLIMEAALRFIQNNQDHPFFCYIPVTIPHAAMHAHKDLHDKYRKQFPAFEDRIGTYAGPDVTNPVAAFPAMLEQLDNDVGRILDLLDTLGLTDNTVVMFTSDNGPHREGGHDPAFWNSNGPFRGLKRDLYEGGIRVPLLVRWPGTVQAGSHSAHVSAFWDMLPTFCEMAGVEVPAETDGISLLPELLGQPQPQHAYLYWEFLESTPLQAIRSGNFKALKTGGPDTARPLELYDLEQDPGEQDNIAAAFPEVVQCMQARFAEAHTASTLFPLA